MHSSQTFIAFSIALISVEIWGDQLEQLCSPLDLEAKKTFISVAVSAAVAFP